MLPNRRTVTSGFLAKSKQAIAVGVIAPLCFALAACGGDSAGSASVSAGTAAVSSTATASTSTGGTTTSTTTGTTGGTGATGGTSTTTTPAPAPVAAGPIQGLAKIASNFDINAELTPAQGTGAIPNSMAPDVVGAFRFFCTPSHESYDDPIVYPGQPGRAHLHQFFGNTGTNAASTYQSLRTTGNSTCGNRLNRSAYWIPAMLNGKGRIVRPDYVSIYYKRRPATDPECARAATACVPIPRGLRFVFGYDMNTMTAAATGTSYFNCDGPTGRPGHYATIAEAAQNCPAGNRIGALVGAPDCWDGVNLDSPDHRSHLSFGSYGGWGYYKCPTTHPYMIPAFVLGAWYAVDGDLDHNGNWGNNLNSWHLSSDAAMGMPAGSTLHADWWGAWDDDVMEMWTEGCINKLLNCSGGDLGNGKQMLNDPNFTFTAVPHTVAMPSR